MKTNSWKKRQNQVKILCQDKLNNKGLKLTLRLESGIGVKRKYQLLLQSLNLPLMDSKQMKRRLRELNSSKTKLMLNQKLEPTLLSNLLAVNLEDLSLVILQNLNSQATEQSMVVKVSMKMKVLSLKHQMIQILKSLLMIWMSMLTQDCLPIQLLMQTYLQSLETLRIMVVFHHAGLEELSQLERLRINLKMCLTLLKVID